jgi:hypothetical protein
VLRSLNVPFLFFPRLTNNPQIESVYPFSFLEIKPLKCRYAYSVHQEDMEQLDVHMEAMHGWLGSMTVCCTPMVRFGKWQIDFHRPQAGDPEIHIDQSKNLLEVERGNDLLAALCIAYAFDKALCQPLVTIIGYQEKEHMDDDDESLDSYDPENAGRPMDRNEPPPRYPQLTAPPEEEEDAFEPAGYLGYADPDNEEEVDGYLEAQPYSDDPSPEVAGYLMDSAHNDNNDEEYDGYLESQPYGDDPDSEVAGYNENGGYSDGYDQNNDEVAGYIDNQEYATDELYASGQQNSEGGYIEAERFHDEP